jgi:Zn finger protein HypA/HybF involved in hydrogenase expression
MSRWTFLLLPLLAFGPGWGVWAAPDVPSSPAPVIAGQESDFQVPPPPLTEGIFPCRECHNADMPANRQRRTLVDMHEDIVLKHDEEHRWCLDCHNPDDRDKLRLASGQLIDFAESYLLCGQCHGDKLRDWKVGVHGKRTGSWNGKKQYLLCIHCHDPHSPRFKPLKPEPPPVRPGRGSASREARHE